MRRVNQAIILIVVLVFSGLIFWGTIIKKNIDNRKLSNPSIDSIVDLILSNKFEDLEKETINDIRIYAEDVLSHSNINEDVINANFILGYLGVQGKNIEEAINKLNEAVGLSNKASESRVMAAIRFQLSKAYLYNKEYEKLEMLFKEAVQICEEKSLGNILVEFYRERAMNVVDIPGGVQTAISLIDKSVELAKKIIIT